MQHASQPVLLAVDDDSDVIAALGEDLRRRYGTDYVVLTEQSSAAALALLERTRAEGDRVALVIADHWMEGTSGVEFLTKASHLHPLARRMLLVGLMDRSVNEPMSTAMALGRIDGWLRTPWEPREERLYLPVTEQLTEWIRATGQPGFAAVRIVGEQWAPRSHEIRDLLDRNAIPFAFHAYDSAAGRDLLREAGRDDSRLPVFVLFDGQVLVDPTNAELAAAIDVPTQPAQGRYDLIVIGAGPAGLSAATYGASEGLRTLLLECEAVGGQAGTSSLIRNYLGFPRGVSGRHLAHLAFQQATLFGASLVYAKALRLRSVGADHVVDLAGGGEAVGRAVVIATGAVYRRLDAEGVDALLGAGVFYGAAASEAPAMAGSHVFVVGGGNSAGQAALHLARYADHVTMVLLEPSLDTLMSDYLVKEIESCEQITVRLHSQVSAAAGHGRLERLTLRDLRSGTTESVEAGALFILIGSQPHTEWLGDAMERDENGFLLTGPDTSGDQAGRVPLLLETSVPGVFAAGDVRHGSIKRVSSAVGEGSIAVQLVHRFLASQ